MELRPGEPSSIEQTDEVDAQDDGSRVSRVSIAWRRGPTRRAREIIVPSAMRDEPVKPIDAATRATLLRSIALGRRWLAEIVVGTVPGPEAIAVRESCSPRRVTMMISLAFLAPDLVKAAIDGRLPRGIGFSRLVDPPADWAHQYAMLGL